MRYEICRVSIKQSKGCQRSNKFCRKYDVSIWWLEILEVPIPVHSTVILVDFPNSEVDYEIKVQKIHL